MSFVPPEAIFESNGGLSFPADIWTLGCAMWAIMSQRPLFEEGQVGPDGVTAEQIDVLGGFPEEWWGKWHSRHNYFDNSGSPAEGRQVVSWEARLDNRIEKPRLEAGLTGFETGEKAAFMDMLSLMFRFRPEERLTTKEILECDWMVKWAMPQFEISRQQDKLV